MSEASVITQRVPAPEREIADGWTLPAAWYSDESVFARERERIFARTWQYVGRADQVSEPGCFFVGQTGHIPVVVVHGRDEALRAFVNVCRHRGHPVMSGEGCRETFQCPYHAWTYDLDGSLRRAPRADREPGFDGSGLSLVPMAVDTWGPFVFVNPDRDAAPLADTLGDLPDVVSESGVDLDGLRFHSHQEWEIASNWKVAIENFLECYHCPVAHPGFSKVIDVDPDAYELTVSDSFSSQRGRIRPSALAGNGKAPYVPRGDVTEAQYHFIWPNTTISIEAGPANVAIERWVPNGLRTSVEVTDYFFGEGVSEEQAQEVIEFGTQVGIEDLALCESVQAGLESRMVPQGRLMLASEQLIHDFQKKIVAALVS
jgi:phenylpropionate dioxygenase-like ring-hydroxylating dioxygenase large terminal subunit